MLCLFSTWSPRICHWCFYTEPVPFSILCFSSVQGDLFITTKNYGGKCNQDLHTPGLANAGYPKAMQLCVSTPIKLGLQKNLLMLPRQPTMLVFHLFESSWNICSIIRCCKHPSFLLAESTGKQYNTYLSRWLTCCQQKHLHMSQATIYDGLEFLKSLFRQGLGYSAINTARSALSAIITLGDKTTFREHLLVTRFMKGIFELKPSLSWYTVIWNVGIVLALQQLTKKLCYSHLLLHNEPDNCETKHNFYTGTTRQTGVYDKRYTQN